MRGAVTFGIETPALSPDAMWPFLLEGWLARVRLFAFRHPGGHFLRRSSNEADRPALFAAQFALNHVCWLVAYPVAAGQAGALLRMPAASALRAVIAAIGLSVGLWKRPAADPRTVEHVHSDLPADHPHLARRNAGPHRHPYVIDDLLTEWPDRN